MIKRVFAQGPLGSYLSINIAEFTPHFEGSPGDPATSTNLLVVDLKGLGPSPATINTQSGVYTPGGQFNYAKHEVRNITLTIIVKDPEEGDTDPVRDLLYQTFATGNKVIFGVWVGDRVGVIDAYVESFQMNTFSKNENAEISLICPYPFFKSQEPVIQFIPPQPITPPIPDLPHYDGHQKAPVYMEITLASALSGTHLRIQNYADVDMKMDLDKAIMETILGRPLQSGDKIRIETASGQKSILLIPHTAPLTRLNILSSLSLDDNWVYIIPGINTVTWHNVGGGPQVEGEMYILYHVLYSGM